MASKYMKNAHGYYSLGKCESKPRDTILHSLEWISFKMKSKGWQGCREIATHTHC